MFSLEFRLKMYQSQISTNEVKLVVDTESTTWRISFKVHTAIVAKILVSVLWIFLGKMINYSRGEH